MFSLPSKFLNATLRGSFLPSSEILVLSIYKYLGSPKNVHVWNHGGFLGGGIKNPQAHSCHPVLFFKHLNPRMGIEALNLA